MKSRKPAEPTVFVPDHIDCETWGQGGSFIVDATGKRTRVPDDAETAPAAPVTVAPAKTGSAKSTAGDK